MWRKPAPAAEIKPFILEYDKEVMLESVASSNINQEMELITKNEPYLERAGEGYPHIKNTQQYEQYLISIYGDYEAVSMKRFRILYNGQPVGQIGMHSFMVRNFQSTAEIFYWIDEAFQGKGIVTRACQRIQFYAYDTLGVDVLYIHCLVANSKSENVAKRCGFHYEGLAKYYDQKIRDYEEYKRYARTVEEFQKEQLDFSRLEIK